MSLPTLPEPETISKCSNCGFICFSPEEWADHLERSTRELAELRENFEVWTSRFVGKSFTLTYLSRYPNPNEKSLGSLGSLEVKIVGLKVPTVYCIGPTLMPIPTALPVFNVDVPEVYSSHYNIESLRGTHSPFRANSPLWPKDFPSELRFMATGKDSSWLEGSIASFLQNRRPHQGYASFAKEHALDV